MEPDNIKKTSQSVKEISLKEIFLELSIWLRYLLSKWIIIVVFGILGSGVGITYAYFKKPVYSAVTTFVLEDDQSNGGGLGSIAGIASMAGLDLGGSGGGIFQGDNIIQLYKSRRMIEKTLFSSADFEEKRQLLIDRYIEFNELRENWKEKEELKNINFANADSLISRGCHLTRLQDSIVGVIVDNINKDYLKVAKLDKKLSIIKTEVVAKDEAFAKAFNEKIVQNVNDFYVQTKTKKSAENVYILQQKTDSVRRVMNGEIFSAARVADATPNLNPTRSTQRAAPIQRSQFSAETNRAILTELVKNLELSKMALRKETPLIQVVDEPVFPLSREKLGKLKGAILGGFLFGFLTVLFLVIRKVIKQNT